MLHLMNYRLPVLLCCSSWLFAGTLPAEVRLEAEKFASPALTGYFGNPALGVPGMVLSARPVWLPDGRILARASFDDLTPQLFPRLCLWQADAATRQVVLRGILNVGGAWCLSPNGALLCAQARTMEDSPQARGRARWTAGAFSCFRMADSVRLWSLPLQRDEQFVGAAFTTDNTRVAVLSVRSRRMTLRLLDAVKGEELRRHDFAGPQEVQDFQEEALLMLPNEIWLRSQSDQALRLQRIPLTSLTPEPVTGLPAGLVDMPGDLRLSPDGRWLALVREMSCVILQQQGGKWTRVFEESAEMNRDGIVKDGFLTVEFAPDGRRAAVLQYSGARVLDLPGGRTLARVDRCFTRGNALAPDGRRLLVNGHSGFAILAFDTLKTVSEPPAAQHQQQPEVLQFLPDGRTLASVDAAGIWLWDVATRQPRARLQASAPHCPECALRSIALTDGGASFAAEEGPNFIRWSLPPLLGAPPATPTMIAAAPAFGGVLVEPTRLEYNSLFASTDGSLIVTQQNQGRDLALHTGLGAKAVRTFAGQGPTMRIQDGQVDVASKLFTYLHPTGDDIIRLDLSSGESETLSGMRDVEGRPVGNTPPRRVQVIAKTLLPEGGGILHYGASGFCVTPLEEEGAVRWLQAIPAGLRHLENPDWKPVVSKDGTTMATFLQQEDSARNHMAVWSLTDGRLLAVCPVPAQNCLGLALSPDGKWLACGHRHAAISLWDVKALERDHAPETVSPPPPASRPPAGAQTQPASRTGTSATPATGLPTRREKSLGSGVWHFLEDGKVSKESLLPEAGTLRLNGSAFQSQSSHLTPVPLLTRYFQAQQDFDAVTRSLPASQTLVREDAYSLIGAGTMAQSEGKVGEVWVSRQIGNPAGRQGRVFLLFTDTLTHTGTEPLQATVEFEVQFPTRSGRLIDSHFKPVNMAANGSLEISPDAQWIAPVLSADSTAPVPVFAFRSLSSNLRPQLIWNAETNRLTVRHETLLPVAEARHLAHGLCLIPRAAGSAPDIFEDPRWLDFAARVPFSVRQRGINFGNDDRWRPEGFSARARDVPHKDNLGFAWQVHRDGSCGGEMGAAAVLQLWLDDAPLAYANSSLFDCRTDAEAHGQTPPSPLVSIHGSNPSRKVTVRREPRSGGGRGMHTLLDIVRNSSAETVQVKLTLMNTFAEPVRMIHSADGSAFEPVGAMDAAQLGGSLIAEFGGDLRPATLLAFHEQGAALTPRLTWLNRQWLRMDYDLTLDAGASAILWHGVAQRPLASFASLTEAFVGCLPFRRASSEKPQAGVSNLR